MVASSPVELVESAEALLALRELGEAAEAFARAEELGADADRCSAGLWMTHMLRGEFERAWQQSDAIRSRGGYDPHRFWLGEELRGRRVMVRALHGFGDTVQMLRYAPRLKEIAAGVVFEVAPDLVELARCFAGVDEVVTWGEGAPAETPEWEVQVEVMELPYLFRTTLGSLPVASGYVRVPEGARQNTAAAMGMSERPRVGLVSAASDWDPRRSLSAAEIEPLVAESGVELWCMDRTHGLRGDRRLRHVRDECGDGLMALAAAIASLDLVVTVDTLAAHLAGAMGKPVWLMLQHASDWRWMVGRNDSPWYPSMRLFRQSRASEWQGVVAEVSGELKGWADGRPAKGRIGHES